MKPGDRQRRLACERPTPIYNVNNYDNCSSSSLGSVDVSSKFRHDPKNVLDYPV